MDKLNSQKISENSRCNVDTTAILIKKKSPKHIILANSALVTKLEEEHKFPLVVNFNMWEKTA